MPYSFYRQYDTAPNIKNTAREDAYAGKFIRYTAPNFIEERDVKACDEIHVNNFTASIIRVMIVKDFLGKDQNADI